MSEPKLARIHVIVAIPVIIVMTITLVIDLISRVIIIVIHVTVVSPNFDLRKLGIEINGSLMPVNGGDFAPNVG